MRKIIMTGALPYANGYIHLGHLVEYLQIDFWNRFQKMRGNLSAYICADDTHGTPIMIRARERGITPEELIAESYKDHLKDFTDFQIHFDHFSSTNSDENKLLCEEFYHKMKSKGHTFKKPIEQLYCPHDQMFLPDRFVKGTCPKCEALDQYGDSCDVCGATYNPNELKNTHCSVCGTTPIKKESEHIFFRLNDFKEYLTQWLPQHTAPEISKKMMEWFKEDLRDWDISRDKPYFGFSIPGETDKFFYVWVDAPMGYVSSTQQWCQQTHQSFDDLWKKSDTAEVYHFIGKDIAYFHTLFWPALLKAADFRTPNQVFVHGHLMVNGEKMSKSKGTFIAARTYLNHLHPQFLRYYYASKLNGSVEDIDLNMDDFTSRVNSDLIGKITNLASRGAQMLTKKMDGVLSECDADGLRLVENAQKKSDLIANFYENRDFAKAIVEIRQIADEANKYFDEKAPWKTLESEPEATKKVLTTTLNLFRIIAIYLKPILPEYVQKVENLFGEQNYSWNDANKILNKISVQNYEHLANRIEPDKIKSMIEESQKLNAEVKKSKQPSLAAQGADVGLNKATSTSQSEKGKKTAPSETPVEIEIDDFMKVDLRIAKIIEASIVPEADKILKLKVELEPGQTKQIFAGIRLAYKPEDLVGRLTIICANLKPRKMKFGMSEGMVLAAGNGGADLFILSPDSGAQPGQRVK